MHHFLKLLRYILQDYYRTTTIYHWTLHQQGVIVLTLSLCLSVCLSVRLSDSLSWSNKHTYTPAFWHESQHVLPVMCCYAKTHAGDNIDPHNSLNIALKHYMCWIWHINLVVHAIIFAKVQTSFFSNSEDLCALCPVESVSGLTISRPCSELKVIFLKVKVTKPKTSSYGRLCMDYYSVKASTEDVTSLHGSFSSSTKCNPDSSLMHLSGRVMMCGVFKVHAFSF